MAIRELIKKEVNVVAGGLVLPKLHLGTALSTILKGLITKVGHIHLLKK